MSTAVAIKPPCAICGRPSHDVHHGRHDNPNMGKGSGGTKHDDHEHFVYLNLDRDCHESIHMKNLIIDEATDLVVRFHTKDGRRGERVLNVSDEELATEWADAAEQGRNAALTQARVAWTFRQRYGWTGGQWWERVADIIRDTTGVSISTGAVYRAMEVGTFLQALPPGTDKAAVLDLAGATLASTLGKVNASPELIEQTLKRVENGEQRTAVAKSLRGDSNSEPKCELSGHVCRYCGKEIA